jgi:hypothetical protein
MLRSLGLFILLGAGLAQAEELGVAPDRAPSFQQQHLKKGFHPLRAIRHMHDGFVNMAIHLSSVGIDQPADLPVPEPLLAEAQHPACANVQLTAMLIPNGDPRLPR